jgi:wyosine [tRNA(Phe)-imidazoG37] synthetase (radical SAM superfamily)
LITFGPVPSRRLGRSLGINNIPYKNCSYSCLYCQLGPTSNLHHQRIPFYHPEEINIAVLAKLEQAYKYGEKIDFLTFVADGEPTLDINLGETITLLKNTGVKIAVISNASLIGNDNVQDGLNRADWVSLKVDTVIEEIWRRLNVPFPTLRFNDILQGVKNFSKHFSGSLVTETMLVNDVNDQPDSLKLLAGFLTELQAVRTYLTIPIRPPARNWVTAPGPETLTFAYQILSEQLQNVELLIGGEGENFAFTGDIIQDLLSITAVHPMTEAAVREFLAKSQSNWQVIQELIERHLLQEILFQGQKFYLRNWQTKL